MMAGRDTNTAVAGGLAGHIPVLLDEVVELLDPNVGDVLVDGTFGDGGYSRALLAAGASVVALDRDPDAIADGRALSAAAKGRLTLVRGRFGALDWISRAAGYDEVDGVVLDVGVSSMQLDRAERGFSFQHDGPLDMRMSREGPTAADLVNNLDQKTLTRIIGLLGEDKKAPLIAKAIVEARQKRPLTRTDELAELIESVVGRRGNDPIHPATRTFQALRIAINQELAELAGALGAAERILRPGGRLVVVTFHSLEDRIVKRFLADRCKTQPTGSRHLPAEPVEPPTFHLLNKAPIVPSAEEVEENPRARSAKLRAAIRTDAEARPVDPAELGVPPIQSIGAME